MKHAAALLLLVLAPSFPRTTGACSLVPVDDGPHLNDPAYESDTVPPGPVTASFDVSRSSGDGSGCGTSHGCGPVSMVHVAVTATDDQAPVEHLGYRVAIVGGQPPPHLGFPTDDRVAVWGEFNWRFDPSYRGAFSFDVEIRAIDLNGNVGPATVLTISDPG